MQDRELLRKYVVSIVVGVIMLVIGLILFYVVQNSSQLSPFFKGIRHAGTFVGLAGIGVVFAGFLLYVIGKNQPEIKEDYEPR